MSLQPQQLEVVTGFQVMAVVTTQALRLGTLLEHLLVLQMGLLVVA